MVIWNVLINLFCLTAARARSLSQYIMASAVRLCAILIDSSLTDAPSSGSLSQGGCQLITLTALVHLTEGAFVNLQK